MKFMLLHDGDGPAGFSMQQRYHEMIEEAVFAEKMGFDSYGISEQHFLPYGACVPSPEILMACVASRTERIKLRFASAVLLKFNHPIRVAERLVTLDIVSRGRAELSTARSNNVRMLEAFEVDPKETRAQWNESIEIIAGLLTKERFEHKGQFWSIPSVSLQPKPIQCPHPPLFVAATSVETCFSAGQKGIGVLTGNSLAGGFEQVERYVHAYRAGLADPRPLTSQTNDCISVFVASAHCAKSKATAVDEARAAATRFIDLVIQIYGDLSTKSPDYSYMSVFKEISERRNDLEWFIERSPFLSIGTSEYLIDRFVRLGRMGIDEMLLRVDAMGHDVNLRSIQRFGEEVIPEVKRRLAMVA